MLNRRNFIASALGTTALLTAAAGAVSLDPADLDIRFGTTGSIFGTWSSGVLKMSTNMEMMLADVRHFGLQGFEPYAAQIIPWLGRPEALKALAERAGVALMDVGDVPPAIGSPPTAGVPADYPWLGGKGR